MLADTVGSADRMPSVSRATSMSSSGEQEEVAVTRVAQVELGRRVGRCSAEEERVRRLLGRRGRGDAISIQRARSSLRQAWGRPTGSAPQAFGRSRTPRPSR
jgi:hypothetical protein